ncbi:MAG: PEP-CTERM sorting domain-containing protein [Verrucomicrobia bacterium]|nr:PEP-CTERM sorting domain-containing protein [Verrucomicrobiota bacterium]
MKALPPFALLLFVLALSRPAPALEILLPGVAVEEDFDGLASAGTANTGLPAGWSFLETGTGANATYAAGAGSSSTGNVYSFGATGSADRALGTLRSASVAASFGTPLVNRTGGTIGGLALSYWGEQWRLGAAGRVDRLDFAYSLDSTGLAGGTWIEVDELDFTAPVTVAASGALNGNDPVNRSHVTLGLRGLHLLPNARLWLRWSDFDASGADDGLGIDDFAVVAIADAAVADSWPAEAPGAVASGLLLIALAIVLQRFTCGRMAAM